jgi:hypothetical protein
MTRRSVDFTVIILRFDAMRLLSCRPAGRGLRPAGRRLSRSSWAPKRTESGSTAGRPCVRVTHSRPSPSPASTPMAGIPPRTRARTHTREQIRHHGSVSAAQHIPILRIIGCLRGSRLGHGSLASAANSARQSADTLLRTAADAARI